MGHSDNMDKRGHKSLINGGLVMNPRGFACSKISVGSLDAHSKSQNYSQGIIHNSAAGGHFAVLDTRYQQSMVGMRGWEIIKLHDSWVDVQGIHMEVSSRAGIRLSLVDVKGVEKFFFGWDSLLSNC